MEEAERASRPPPPAPGSVPALFGSLSEKYGPRRQGDLPWERGDSYLIGQLGRAGVIVMLCLATLYLLSPVSFTGTSDLLSVGKSFAGTIVFEALTALSAVVLLLSALIVWRSQQWLPRTMILQTDVPWEELARLVTSRLKDIGASRDKTPLGGRGVLQGAAFQVRGDYPPVRVIGSSLGYVTWGGARSFFVVPLVLFRHPRLGQDLDNLMRDVLGWERPEKVSTPTVTTLEEESS